MNKHTQGEWEVIGSLDEIEIVRTYSHTTTRIASVKCYDSHVPHYSESEANAKLIASAPDLLNTLFELKDSINNKGRHLNSADQTLIVSSIIKAIKKATS